MSHIDSIIACGFLRNCICVDCLISPKCSQKLSILLSCDNLCQPISRLLSTTGGMLKSLFQFNNNKKSFAVVADWLKNNPEPSGRLIERALIIAYELNERGALWASK